LDSSKLDLMLSRLALPGIAAYVDQEGVINAETPFTFVRINCNGVAPALPDTADIQAGSQYQFDGCG
jgi:hypothetical protein